MPSVDQKWWEIWISVDDISTWCRYKSYVHTQKRHPEAPQEAAANVTPDHLGRPSHLTRMDEFLFDAVYFFVQYATAIVVICLSISEHSTVSGKVVSQ